MRDEIKKIFRQDEPPRRFCRVKAVMPDGRYRVEDDGGMWRIVDGPAGYLPESNVVVQGGRIVGYGTSGAVTKTIRV